MNDAILKPQDVRPAAALARPRSVRLAALALLLAVLPGSASQAERADRYGEVNTSWDRFGAVYSRVIESYYAPVDHEKAMRAAIEGLLRQLDSYSQYYDEEGLRQLRQDTTGKFAGLGITVGIKDHYPVVIAPIESTPAARAGLQPGDLIVAIEGRDSFGRTLEEVVAELRGEPGSAVRITVARQGVAAHWDVVIVREVIQIKSVAVADEVVPGVGYISMRGTRFSEETSSEMETAIRDLQARGVTGLILDLRGNPGGLLSQATEVADLFLPKGAAIVTVREREGRREDTKYSERAPPASDLPLVVLIDGGSASAAEIVAGAIQDNDRGLIVGTPSFGKGSVQTIFDMRESDQAALKLTTALYFTPSGRSIHRESVNAPAGMLLPVTIGDVQLPSGLLLSVLLRAPDPQAAAEQLRARFDLDEAAARQVLATPLGQLAGHLPNEPDSADQAAAKSYHTAHGRAVHGGGGIAPDVTVEPDLAPAYVRELQRHRVFFDFVVEYVAGLAAPADSGQVPEDVDEEMLRQFRAYIPRSAMAEARHEQTLQELKDLRQLAGESGWDGDILARIDSLQSAIDRHDVEMPFTPPVEAHIRAELRRELALRFGGRKASLLVNLDTDPQVTQAVRLLQDPERYRRLLSGG